MTPIHRTTYPVFLSLLCVALLGAPVMAGEGDLSRAELEKLVKEQGRQLQQLKSEMGRLKASSDARGRADLEEDIGDYLDSTSGQFQDVMRTVQRPGLLGRTRLGGYFSLEFREDGEGIPMTFDQHRLVLLLQSQIAPGIAFETEIEIEGGGADVDFLTGNEILVEYAELGFELIEDRLIFDVGIILIPWGRFNFHHDDPLNDLTDRPLVARRLAAVAFGQPGIAAEGTFEIGRWFLDYDIALVQGFDDGFTTNGGVRGARQSYRQDNNDNKQVFGRLVTSPPTEHLDVLEAGGSFNVGKHDPAGMYTNWGLGGELFLKKGPFELVAEYMFQRIEQPDTAPNTDPRRMSGWYVDLIYHFFPSSWRGAHKLFTAESTFTLIVRIEGIDLNHSTTGATFRDDLMQITLGFNFRPIERTVFKISYTWVDTEDPSVPSGSADRFLISWASYF